MTNIRHPVQDVVLTSLFVVIVTKPKPGQRLFKNRNTSVRSYVRHIQQPAHSCTYKQALLIAPEKNIYFVSVQYKYNLKELVINYPKKTPLPKQDFSDQIQMGY